MLTLITGEQNIRKCQKELENILTKNLNSKDNFKIGFQGVSLEKTIRYSSEIWYFSCEDGERDESSYRFWNAFGLSNLLDNKISNNITVEINIPIQRINRRINGLFAVDEKGSIFLLHRGKLGGGRKGIGKNNFINFYNQSFINVRNDSDNKIDQVLMIGNILEDNFMENITNFIKKVAQFKLHILSKEDDELPQNNHKEKQ